MLAELVHHVVGVDPDRDWITLAVVDARTSGVVAEGRFPATGDGYRDAVELVDGHKAVRDVPPRLPVMRPDAGARVCRPRARHQAERFRVLIASGR